MALTGRVKKAWRAVGKQRTAWSGVQAKPQCCLDFFTFLSSNGDGVYRLVPFFNFCSLDRFMTPPPTYLPLPFLHPRFSPPPLGRGRGPMRGGGQAGLSSGRREPRSRHLLRGFFAAARGGFAVVTSWLVQTFVKQVVPLQWAEGWGGG